MLSVPQAPRGFLHEQAQQFSKQWGLQHNPRLWLLLRTPALPAEPLKPPLRRPGRPSAQGSSAEKSIQSSSPPDFKEGLGLLPSTPTPTPTSGSVHHSSLGRPPRAHASTRQPTNASAIPVSGSTARAPHVPSSAPCSSPQPRPRVPSRPREACSADLCLAYPLPPPPPTSCSDLSACANAAADSTSTCTRTRASQSHPQPPWAGHGEASASPTAAPSTARPAAPRAAARASAAARTAPAPRPGRGPRRRPSWLPSRRYDAGWPHPVSPRLPPRAVAHRANVTCRAEAAHPRGGIPEEEGKLLHAHLLDLQHAGHLLRRPLHGPHLHHRHHLRRPDRVLQGGHRHRQRPQPRPLHPLHQEPQLVLARHHHVLSLRRERHLLLQAYRPRRQGAAAPGHAPPLHQLHPLRLWLRLVRRHAQGRPLQVPVHQLCLDAHGAVPHRRAGALRHEQHLRGHDLVLLASRPRHHQRHLRVHLRHRLWPHPAHQAVPQEDGRGLCRCLGHDAHLVHAARQSHDTLQVLHLPGQRPRRQHLHGSAVRSQPRLRPSHVPHAAVLLPAAQHDLLPHVRAHADPRDGAGDVCLADRALWRLLRLWAEAHLQDQGLWRLDPRSRRHDGPHGLPVHHGLLRLHVLPHVRCRLQGDAGIRDRDGHHEPQPGRAGGACQGHGEVPRQPGRCAGTVPGMHRHGHGKAMSTMTCFFASTSYFLFINFP